MIGRSLPTQWLRRQGTGTEVCRRGPRAAYLGGGPSGRPGAGVLACAAAGTGRPRPGGVGVCVCGSTTDAYSAVF